MSRDVWADELYTASLGGIEIDLLMTDDSIARALVAHRYARKDGGDLVDFGAEPRETRCRLVFFERDPIEGESDASADNHLERFAACLAMFRRGGAVDFVHPITGQMQVMIADFAFRANAEDPNAIDVDCTLVEDTTTPAVYDAGNGRPIDAGAAAVAVEAENLDALAEEMAVEFDAEDVAATVASWESDPDLAVREVNLQLGRISQQIDDAISVYDMASDPSMFPLYRSLQRLHYSARRAADRFREAQPQTYEVTLTVPKPLRVFVAENYGAADVEERYNDILRLNDIDDPLLIPAGTTLKVPARSRLERIKAAF